MGEDFWITKNVTTPYGISLWRSIWNLWMYLKNRVRINIKDGRKTLFWEDNWMDRDSIKALFPDMYDLSLQQRATIRCMVC